MKYVLWWRRRQWRHRGRAPSVTSHDRLPIFFKCQWCHVTWSPLNIVKQQVRSIRSVDSYESPLTAAVYQVCKVTPKHIMAIICLVIIVIIVIIRGHYQTAYILLPVDSRHLGNTPYPTEWISVAIHRENTYATPGTVVYRRNCLQLEVVVISGSQFAGVAIRRIRTVVRLIPCVFYCSGSRP